jgi:hypothetical protein
VVVVVVVVVVLLGLMVAVGAGAGRAVGSGAGARLGLRNCTTAVTVEATTRVTLGTDALRLVAKDAPERDVITDNANVAGDLRL